MAAGNNRLLTIGAAAGSLMLLVAAVFFLWPSDSVDPGLSSARDGSDGETVGWVSKVDGNRLHVNAGPFGGGIVLLEVTQHTRISAGAKEGWFEDIRPGGQVKVAYEIYRGRRLARTVELLVDDGSRRPIRAEPRIKSTGAGSTGEPLPAKPGVATTTAPDARPAAAPRAAEPAPATAKAKPPEPAPGPVAAPVAPARPAPLGQPETRPAPKPDAARSQPAEVPPPQRASTAPARSTVAVDNGTRAPEPARAPSPAPAGAGRSAEPARSAEPGDSTDGSAAVDWFLKGRR